MRHPGMRSQVGLRMNHYKASGGDGIPAELLEILKVNAIKAPHSICQRIWKTQQWPQDWKKSVFIPVPKKGNVKEFQTAAQLHSFHTLAKSYSKYFKIGFNSVWTKNFQMYKLDLEEAEDPEIKLPTSVYRKSKIYILEEARFDYRKSKRIPEKHLLQFHWPKLLTMWIMTNSGKFWKRREHQTTWPAFWETCVQVRKQQLEPDMEQWTGSNWKRSMSKLYVVTLFI